MGSKSSVPQVHVNFHNFLCKYNIQDLPLWASRETAGRSGGCSTPPSSRQHAPPIVPLDQDAVLGNFNWFVTAKLSCEQIHCCRPANCSQPTNFDVLCHSRCLPKVSCSGIGSAVSSFRKGSICSEASYRASSVVSLAKERSIFK